MTWVENIRVACAFTLLTNSWPDVFLNDATVANSILNKTFMLATVQPVSPMSNNIVHSPREDIPFFCSDILSKPGHAN